MLPIALHEFLDERGRSPFKKWILSLDDYAAARINKYLERLADGNVSNVKGVGKGVSEVRVDFGPGYRIYFGWDGALIVILLGGGSKNRQQQDIADAQLRWSIHKHRKQGKL